LVVEPSLEKKITSPGTFCAHVRTTVGARVVRKSLLVITAIRINCFFCDTRGKFTDAISNEFVRFVSKPNSPFSCKENSSVKHRFKLQINKRPI